MQIILNAMKTYGIILADNGSNWYVSGAPDARWNNDMLHLLDDLTGNDFEAVDEFGAYGQLQFWRDRFYHFWQCRDSGRNAQLYGRHT